MCKYSSSNGISLGQDTNGPQVVLVQIDELISMNYTISIDRLVNYFNCRNMPYSGMLVLLTAQRMCR